MKRRYAVAPLVLALGFLGYFTYWSREDDRRFAKEGPGALVHARAISGSGIVRYDEPAIIKDGATINAVVSLLIPKRSAWSRMSAIPSARGVIRFSTPEGTIVIQVGQDFVACGEYFRWVPQTTITEVYEILSRAAVAPQSA